MFTRYSGKQLYMLFGSFLIVGSYLAQFVEYDRSGKIAGLYVVFWLLFVGCQPIRGALSRSEIIFLGLLSALFLSTIPSYFVSEDVSKAGGEMEKLCKFIVIPAALLFILKRIEFKLDYFVTCLCLSGYVIGGVAIYDLWAGHSRLDLFYGRYISQGCIAFLVFALLLGLFRLVKYRSAAVLAMVCALLSLFVSETRGAWIAVIPVVVLKVYFEFSQKEVSGWMKAVALLSILIGFGLVSMNESVQRRALDAHSDVSSYIVSSEKYAFSSIGVRFELIRSGWKIFSEYPLAGAGVGDSEAHFLEYDRYGYIEKMVGGRGHFHNDIIQSLALRGVVNTIVFLCMFIWLVYYFWPRRNDSNYISSLKEAGLYFVISVFVFGLSIPFLAGNKGIVLFTMSVTILLSLIESYQNDKGGAA